MEFFLLSTNFSNTPLGYLLASFKYIQFSNSQHYYSKKCNIFIRSACMNIAYNLYGFTQQWFFLELYCLHRKHTTLTYDNQIKDIRCF